MTEKKKWMVYATWGAALATGVVVGILLVGKDGNDSLLARLLTHAGKADVVAGTSYELVLARHYLCGVREEEQVSVRTNQLADIMGNYNGWEIVRAEPIKMTLMKREQDIAPACKENGHIGIAADGMLALFHGLPAEKDVVQTFYRIDTAKMEASLPKEEWENLKRGIRIRNLAEYNSVVSTYGEFQWSGR
ncbi:BofC C-terminal domain-containing protein [Brevibacillus fortis]|uniref:BofC C-terminal domain-containing protein n=1 Tax=Brevibacillus fortis TaxID=2126352 RepID=UPI002E1D30B3|nr:BofC C-terminal domain-containing protein [Brevibacillus fortis]